MDIDNTMKFSLGFRSLVVLDFVLVVTKSGATADTRSTGVRSGHRADLKDQCTYTVSP